MLNCGKCDRIRHTYTSRKQPIVKPSGLPLCFLCYARDSAERIYTYMFLGYSRLKEYHTFDVSSITIQVEEVVYLKTVGYW